MTWNDSMEKKRKDLIETNSLFEVSDYRGISDVDIAERVGSLGGGDL
jgi:hypothetical protein